MWCCRKPELEIEKSAELRPCNLYILEKTRKEIKPFHEMFRIITFGMSLGLLYPNPVTEKQRFRSLIIVFITSIPITFIIIADIYSSWIRKDIQNIVRHCTIVIPFILGLSKMLLFYIHRHAAQEIIDEMNHDHETCNNLPESYREIIEDHFKNAKFGEKYWLFIVIMVILIFPMMSSVLNLYEYLLSATPHKYMIHDVNIPFMEPEARFETPYFELLYLYMMYCCAILFVSFLSYDGFFGLAIRHACLKMRLYCQTIDEALKLEDKEQIVRKLVEVIRAQCRVYNFVVTIQRTFNFWLGVIFTGTIVHVCNCMYQIIVGTGLDCRYVIFIAGSVVHIYLPCNYASRLQIMSTDTATLIYCSGWETVYDQRIRKMLLYMIARAQLPMNITAFNIINFDMELFVSVLRTAYSMFTLLRPTD